MTRTIVTSRVGEDGILTVNVLLGPGEANREVKVTIEPVSPTRMTVEEWRAWVEKTAGSWQGEFERPPQGEFEDRLPL